MRKSSTDEANQNDWTECRPGELCSLGERLRSDYLRTKHASAYRTVAACALVVLLSLGASQWLRSADRLGGMTCMECVAQFDAYHDHLSGTANMAPEQAKQLQEHLANCKKCQSFYENKLSIQLSEAFRWTGALLALR